MIKQHWKRVLVLVIIVIVGWWEYTKIQGGGQGVQYQTTTAEKKTLVASVAASGSVTAANSMAVTTQVTGIVSKVMVKDGDVVKMGQTMFILEPDLAGTQAEASAYASYLSAKNGLDAARRNVYSLQSSMYAANQKLINDAVARDLAADDPTYIQQNADWKAAEGAYINQQNVIAQAQSSLSSAWGAYRQSSRTIVA